VLEEAIKIYTEVRRSGYTIDEMDIFIAAWCRVNDFTLVTNNTDHFAPVSGLAVVDWSVGMPAPQ
jgi:predicted nucleic acid-binding protein